jgi:predicted dehydrogenase
MLRVGIVGCGRISDLHALGYLEHPGATITAVCDTVDELARERGAVWGVPDDAVHTSAMELFDREDVDAVELLVPHHLHAELTAAAFAAGKHVSLQKPMGLSLAEADAMISQARAAGTAFKVFENFVFYPPIQRAKALLADGAIGDPLSIRLKSNAGCSETAWEVPPAAAMWRFDPASCGGGPVVFDDGHHKFSTAWYLFDGLPQEVTALIGADELAPGFVLDAPSIVSWRYADGRIGSLEAVVSPGLELWTEQYAQDDRIEITGTEGVLWVMQGHGRMLDVPPVVLYRDRQVRTFSDMATAWASSFVASARHFVDAIATGSPPSLTGEQGREILRFALAAQRAGASGRTVTLADGDRIAEASAVPGPKVR